MTSEPTVTLWAVIFTDDDGMTTDHTAHLTEEEAMRTGAELARSRWAEDEELSEDPFPEADSDTEAMDVLRTALDVHLEVEAVEVSATVLRAALALLEAASGGQQHRARPDDDPEPGDRCKDCGEDITWMGPSHSDWAHGDES